MQHHVHDQHPHKHSIACGHTKIRHEDHIDFLHSGHLHREHEGHWDECNVPVNDMNPDVCAPTSCGCNHSEECGHELVPHGDHMDYLINGRLHHVHEDHCDDHGPVEVVTVI